MNLIFDLVRCFLFATHCIIMMIICTKLFLNPTMHVKVMGRTRTRFTEAYVQSLSAAVTLTFDLVICFLFVTCRLVMMIICVKLFINPIMHDKVKTRI